MTQSIDMTQPTDMIQPTGLLRPARIPYYACWLWLFGPLLILALSFVLQPGEDRKVLLPWSQVALPEACYFYNLFRTNCPGCGLTRSFLHISRGNFQTAFQLNPVGIFLYTYLALQIPQALLRWPGLQQKQAWIDNARLSRLTRLNEWALIGLLLALVLQWVIRLILGE